ncbi:MAG TPA: exopolysaccharide biosynthesis protein [Devosia sp.]|nr:exopolysaccharide biosynthesis protein [Devosia sp.]
MTEPHQPIHLEHVDRAEGADRLSAILSSIACAQDRERISIGDLLDALRHRALGALMFIFAVPTALPMPPGVSAVVGAPLLFLSAQLMLGMKPWLPKLITDRSLSRVDFEKVVTVVTPWLARAEGIMRPRMTFLAAKPSVYVIGLLCLILSIILFLPIPLGNMLPSIAIAIMSLGLLERDGVWIVLGFVTGIVSIFVVWGVLWAMVFAAFFVVRTVFGIG